MRMYKEVPYSVQLTLEDWTPFNDGSLRAEFILSTPNEQVSPWCGVQAMICSMIRSYDVAFTSGGESRPTVGVSSFLMVATAQGLDPPFLDAPSW